MEIIKIKKLPKCLNKIVYEYWGDPKKNKNNELLGIFKDKDTNKKKDFLLKILIKRAHFILTIFCL